MALNKQPLSVNFSQGLDSKTDKFQIPVGKFLTLENSTFDVLGRLTKREGLADLPALPIDTATYLTTFNENLTAIGSSFYAYSVDSSQWINKGGIQPVDLSTLSLIKSNLHQTQVDTVVAPNGLVCTVYTDVGSSTAYKYAVADSITGQNIVSPTLIPAASGGTVSGSARVFLLGRYFVIVFTNNISGTNHLQYIAISYTMPTIVTSPVDVVSSYIPASTVSWDGVVTNDRLFIGYNTTSGGQSVKITYIPAALGTIPVPAVYSSSIATMMSLTADNTVSSSPTIYASFYDSASSTGYTVAVDQNLNKLSGFPTQIITSGTILNMTSAAQNGTCQIFYEVSNQYSYTSINTNFIQYGSVTSAGTFVAGAILIRSLGLASKAFISNGVVYMVGIQNSAYQPTYFVLNAAAMIVAKLAYQNGGSYLTLGLPNVTVNDSIVQFPYLFKDLIQSVNKDTNVPTGTQVAGIYAQTGINLATVNLTSTNISSAEIGENLNVSGGFLWAYDGYLPVEQGFFLYPENVVVSTSTSGGSLAAQQYFYQATYEWSDNQGNIFRSAPSIPVSVTTTGSASSNTINVPTLRLTYKTANPVKIVIYRWSTAQEAYYQVTSITSPLLNSITADSVSFVDTLADATILGNNLIYTSGGVLENISPTASSVLNLFNNRLWMVNAEDPNVLEYSKQIIEGTPVEMSDLLTYYVAPTIGSQGSTGPTKTLASMDDKQIIFKANAIYYMNGIGPDSTGANGQYSDPLFITTAVGCANPKSTVLIPSGLMFQSPTKGIWLLSRGLETTFIGNEVQIYTNGATVTSALSIPGTNQIKFTLDTGVTLMYDYFVGQWGVHTISAVSSTLYQGLHTILLDTGAIRQQTPNLYLDGTRPVLMNIKTNWMSLSGLQGFERFYFMYLLGTYITPFKLQVQFAYDFNDSNSQSVMVTPDNYTPEWGDEAVWGGGPPWGGVGSAFKARIFPQIQKCESFQVSITEIYDPSLSVQAGAGLTLSGLNVIAGMKKGYRTQTANRSFG